MRKFLIAFVLLLGVVFFIGKYAEIQAIGETLRHGDWRYLGLALGLEVVWLFTVAMTYWVIYRKIGLDEKVETLLLASSGAYFANVVAPTAGASGLAVFISTARRRGYSTARTTIAGLLYLLFDYLGFCVLSWIDCSLRRNDLNIPEIIASIALLLIAGSWFLALPRFHSARQPTRFSLVRSPG
jgi:uncharacterized membrane protein YbhN (UPF0104 family)